MDLIDRQAAIDAVSYAMRNGGDWRPALEAVPSWPPEAKVLRVHVRAREWVPVSEELPYDDRMVLVTAQPKKGDPNVNRAYYANGAWHGSGSMANVTAWMDMPEPYEKEDNNGQL